MIYLIFQNKLAIMNFLNLIVWYYFYKNSNLSGFNKTIVRYFVYFFALYTLWDLMMIIGESSGKIYLFFWAVISIYELYFLITVLFKLAGWEYKWLVILIPSLPIILGPIVSYTESNYQYVNTADFFNTIILLFCSILILRFVLVQDKFINNLETFFIFTGFALYFSLHILATNIMSLDFVENWSFADISTLIVLYYWIGSVLCIQNIKSKYSS